MSLDRVLRIALLVMATAAALVPRYLIDHAADAADTPSYVIVAGAIPLAGIVWALANSALSGICNRRVRATRSLLFTMLTVVPTTEQLDLGAPGVFVTCCLAWLLVVPVFQGKAA